MQYIITNTEPTTIQPDTVYFITNNNQDNYRLMDINSDGATIIDQSNYLNYIRTSTNDYINQFYGRQSGLIIPLNVNPNNILVQADTIIQNTIDKRYPIGVILLFTNPIQYNNNVNQAINSLLENSIMVFAGINVGNRNIENILTDIDTIANTYKQIRGIYFNNINQYINNNNYLYANILTGYAFYRKFELISIGIDNMIVDDQNLLNIISDLYVYDLQLPTFSQNDLQGSVLKNKLVAIIKNKQGLNYLDIESYFNHVKFGYFTDLLSFDDLPTYFQTLTDLLNRYNFRSIIQYATNEIQNIQNTINNMNSQLTQTTQDTANALSTANYAVSRINTLESMLQDLSQQFSTGQFVKDYFRMSESVDYIIYGKKQQSDAQFRFNKNFIYLIPFEVNTITRLDQLSIYKLFDRLNNGSIYIGIFDTDSNNYPANKLYEAELVINQPFGKISTSNNINLLLTINKVYYFAITANNDLLVKGLSPNNINHLFGIHNKTNRPLIGFTLPTRNNILPNSITVQDLRPYFEIVPAIYANIVQG